MWAVGTVCVGDTELAVFVVLCFVSQLQCTVVHYIIGKLSMSLYVHYYLAIVTIDVTLLLLLTRSLSLSLSLFLSI